MKSKAKIKLDYVAVKILEDINVSALACRENETSCIVDKKTSGSFDTREVHSWIAASMNKKHETYNIDRLNDEYSKALSEMIVNTEKTR